jgi:hypothetical protein
LNIIQIVIAIGVGLALAVVLALIWAAVYRKRADAQLAEARQSGERIIEDDHRIYAVAAGVHSSWRAVGVPFEVGPFADHTTHLTLEAAEDLFQNLPLQILSARSNVDESKARARKQPPRHVGDRLKRVFFKNALYEVVARRA